MGRPWRLLVICMLVGCSSTPAQTDAAIVPGWSPAVPLPEPITDNAVAAIGAGGDCTLYTALGLDASRGQAGIQRRAYAWTVGDPSWTPLPDVPGAVGRIAASGVALRGHLYVVGGYSVAPDGSETSHADVDVFDPQAGGWSAGPALPIPIDDAVAVAWRDRWIVVVSGWSNTESVAAVQVFDADTGTWSMGTLFPGTPVFGAAGALAGDELVVIDGVASGPGGFSLVNQAWHARLDPADPTTLAWTSLGAHPAPARYRAAAGAADGRLLFHGGTADPYNYDGLSYATGQPSPPLASTLVFDLAAGQFTEGPPDKPSATMDHRALVGCGGALYTVGGMLAGPTVTAEVWQLEP